MFLSIDLGSIRFKAAIYTPELDLLLLRHELFVIPCIADIGISKVVDYALWRTLDQSHMAGGNLEKLLPASGWSDRGNLLFQISVESFIWIEFGAITRQKENLNLSGMLFNPRFDRFAVVNPQVV